ncbi:hypothetical protein PFICI_08706 [Pestalotiopsis fici W106-1]|uniref:Uncharacterized protein n=1 Tax=Pestalotiopsis fici (strain W106-1 / CGMCC3.15140) TaxID=1229662 RepID=W3WYA0_PESFW|nr:uncharacterized protein PFICI_08706 [Pestalotiopsis fici W106-1]ETS78853.1 hypothetical protein PFICI_08706 [Pestalotiopsis fici W106-1]
MTSSNGNTSHWNGESSVPDKLLSIMDDDPVCVVGIACRLPGDVRSPSDMWDFLVDKKSAQGRVPAARFNIDGFHCTNDGRPGVIAADGGYFLNEDVRLFDNDFFGINNLEAKSMDPHQRKLLEITYECLESAGISMENASNSNTGVYVSNFTVDFTNMHFRDPDYMHRYSSTGSNMAILANRISHVFNFHGPSLAVNTACSSSFYCLHTAVQALQTGDCDGAVVAGANLIMSPEMHLETMKGGVLSPTSTCHTFDEAADGYGRAEGINAVYLKRLSAAVKDGNKIWGVIRGTAVNSNGKTTGIAQPSAAFQEAVIQKAYANAKLDPLGTDYVECHGTGTSVGDATEVEALRRCFPPREGMPLMIGSVKTNFGHSEAASGLTSLIKVLLAFENDMIPPTYGLKKLSPKLPLDSMNMKVVTQPEMWPSSTRRASINCFGYGGANAHTIVESLESYLGTQKARRRMLHPASDKKFVIPLSAKSSESLQLRMSQIWNMTQSSLTSLEDLSFTLSQRIYNFEHRKCLLADSTTHVEVGASGTTKSTPRHSLPAAFIFTGQGAQYAGMASNLIAQNQTFCQTIRQLDRTLQSLPDGQKPMWTLEQEISNSSTDNVNRASYSQPLCTAIQIGIVDVLRAWGVSPSAVLGHSSGEIAAAYAAGLLTASQAIIVAYLRGYAVESFYVPGAMLAVGLGQRAVECIIQEKDLKKEVCVACINDSENVTISGTEDAIEILHLELQAQGKFVRQLDTGGKAYHSHLMRDTGDLYERLITPFLDCATLALRHNAKVDMFSTAGSIALHAEECASPTYWRKNLENTVQFSSALTRLVEAGDYHLIEIGPHHALKGPVLRTLASNKKKDLPYSVTLSRDSDSDLAMKILAGSLFSHGHELDWAEVNGISDDASALVNIPPYPWNYSSPLLWEESRTSSDLRNRKHVRHELIGSQQLAGSGLQWAWRNLLSLNEIPWLRDHKLEAQIVFPAAGYIAMAIESFSQVQSAPQNDRGFELRDVAINKALVIPDNSEAGNEDIFCIYLGRMVRVLGVLVESRGAATEHCAGYIRTANAPEKEGAVLLQTNDNYDRWNMNKWYQKLREEGLNFGPSFQSVTGLSTHGSRKQQAAVGETNLESPPSTGSAYMIHPIAIDACIQTAIFGFTGGNVATLGAWMPVFISQCHVQPPRAGETKATIHTRSVATGFTRMVLDCTLRDGRGYPVLDMKDVRTSRYHGSIDQREIDQRHPCLRIHWKPDITRVGPGSDTALARYVNNAFQQEEGDSMNDMRQSIVTILLDLVAHKMPNMRALELSGLCSCKTREWLDLLDQDTDFPRCGSWHRGNVLENGEIEVENDSEGLFNLVVALEYTSSHNGWVKEILSRMSSNLSFVIARRTPELVNVLISANFSVTDVGCNIILATRSAQSSFPKGKKVVLVYRENSPATDQLTEALTAYFEKTVDVGLVQRVSLTGIHSAGLDQETFCISLLELENEFLASMNPEDMDLLREMTGKVSDLSWITGSSGLEESNPRLTMAHGLSRSLMLEQPSMRFTVVDIGRHRDFEQTMALTCSNLLQAFVAQGDTDDKEFIQRDGLLYISRFAPDKDLNTLFRMRQEERGKVHTCNDTLRNAGVCRFAVGTPGLMDSIYFKQLREPPTDLPGGAVDIQIKAVSLNAKDIYNLHGRLDIRGATTACEFSGEVLKVAHDVEHLQAGDRVVAMVPNYFTTTERVPAWTVQKLLPDEDFATLSTILVPYSTALYALHDCARLSKGESILIHAGSGALGIAAINVAQRAGATVYTTTSSDVKKNFLVSQFGIKPSHIFSSRDSSFVQGIHLATAGRGVDVVLNSLVGDLMHASWRCIADFGRFVEVSKRELVDAGRLDMIMFQRNATFTAFDLSEMFHSNHPAQLSKYARNMKTALDWYRSGKIKTNPFKVFDVSDITSAYRYFSSAERIGKVVVSLENGLSQIRVSPPRYQSLLDPSKVYLLVGCLGGLGRSISRWMATRGARRLVFLGRSGCDSPSAQRLVSLLEDADVKVKVVKGDVTRCDDVLEAVEACKALGGPIGGVIQAAMGLQEALFSRMSNDAWHQGIDAKWAGTWNLHNAIDGCDDDLDFFFMTSSISGTVGIATEANYCASNGFLDAFARWRREQGKPAVSVGLGMVSEVGYLHENPKIEAILLRRGIYPLNEEDFLQIVDFGITSSANLDLAQAHILTGLESLGLQNLMAKGFDVNNLPFQDPRASIVAHALEVQNLTRTAHHAGKKGRFAASSAVWAEEAQQTGLDSLSTATDAKSHRDAVLKVIQKQFSNLILTPLDAILVTKPLAQFGVDSMIASEFRTWFWATFKIDVPFLDLLSATRSLSSLADSVVEKLRQA